MPKMNGKGPEGKGSKTGRGLGRCKTISPEELKSNAGKGPGKRRHAGGGQGKGKRSGRGLK